MINEKALVESSIFTLESIVDLLNQQEAVSLESFEKKDTVLVLVDMINGFAKEGALMSPRVSLLIPEVVRLSKAMQKKQIQQIALADYHSEESVEFQSYVPHCIATTDECEIVDEIKALGGYKLIKKNSTNGFLEDEFQSWFKSNSDIKNYIIVGDCTDICVQQFALSVKAWFNKENKTSRVIVPMNAVDTYDYEMHNGDLMHVMALYNMFSNGVEVVKSII